MNINGYKNTDVFWWHRPSELLPDEGEGEVLVIASGDTGGATLIDAYELAEYSKDEGWILECFPDAENIEVTWWARLPDAPEEGLQ